MDDAYLRNESLDRLINEASLLMLVASPERPDKKIDQLNEPRSHGVDEQRELTLEDADGSEHSAVLPQTPDGSEAVRIEQIHEETGLPHS